MHTRRSTRNTQLKPPGGPRGAGVRSAMLSQEWWRYIERLHSVAQTRVRERSITSTVCPWYKYLAPYQMRALVLYAYALLEP